MGDNAIHHQLGVIRTLSLTFDRPRPASSPGTPCNLRTEVMDALPPSLICTTEAPYTIVYANEEMQRLFGRSSTEMLGM